MENTFNRQMYWGLLDPMQPSKGNVFFNIDL